jgi:hypothetical protein
VTSTLSLSAQFESFVEEWLATRSSFKKASEAGELDHAVRELVILQHLERANFVSQKGYLILDDLAERLLESLNLSFKVGVGTARDALLKSFSYYLKKSKSERVSSDAVVKRAEGELLGISLPSGVYVFAARFSHNAKGCKFHVGPVTIISKARFYRENADKLRRGWPGSERDHDYLLRKWITYVKDFDHLLLVNLEKYEHDLGWRVARECAEFALNLIRMFFGFHYTKRIRLAGDFALNQNRASMIIEDSNISLSYGIGGVSSFLENDWADIFDQELRSMSALLVSFVDMLASGRQLGSPAVERFRYANTLVAEAYCEPSDHLRLVRLISALEAIAVIRGGDKSHTLALRCATVGAWGDRTLACEIYEAVRFAYHWRNMVVHGDAPSESETRAAFLKIERYSFRIFVGFLGFFARLERTVAPKSIRGLAREIRDRMDYYIYDPDFGFD